MVRLRSRVQIPSQAFNISFKNITQLPKLMSNKHLQGKYVEVKIKGTNDTICRRVKTILEEELKLVRTTRPTGTSTRYSCPEHHRDIVVLSYQKSRIGNPFSYLVLENNNSIDFPVPQMTIITQCPLNEEDCDISGIIARAIRRRIRGLEFYLKVPEEIFFRRV